MKAPEDYRAHLKTAYKALAAKRSAYSSLFGYYDGDHPLRYSAAKLREVFSSIDVVFRENWCGVVVDSLLDRLSLTGFSTAEGVPEKARVAEALKTLWTVIESDVDEAHEAVAICGETYVIVWPDSSDTSRPRPFHNDPRLCHIFYDEDDPQRKAYAAKCWDADNRRYLTLYYEDAFVHFESSGTANAVTGPGSFVQIDIETHEAGVVPVVHMRTRKRRPLGELKDACIVQDGLNKSLNDLMVAGEFDSLPQRYAITAADVTNFRPRPGTTAKIPPAAAGSEETQVGQFQTADLSRFIAVIDHFANTMSAITRTPKHFFFQQGGNVSGDALIAMEAPLTKKAKRYITHLSSGWSEVAVLALRLQGITVNERDIVTTWGDERTVQPVAEATALSQMVAAGMPLRTALRRQGWTEADLKKLDEDKALEAQGAATEAALKLAAARRLSQGGVM